MNVNFFYATAPGRFLLKAFMNSGAMTAVAEFLRCPASRVLIGPYIRLHQIDMFDFRKQSYYSFADFFARKRDRIICGGGENNLISPCDGMLSIFPINDVKGIPRFPVKGSLYRISDLVTDKTAASRFANGCCLIYRLEASDYHHFCYIDDCYQGEEHMIKGSLHSVQPAACARIPVYRLNRRMWSLMETRHLGLVAQIEVGALLVGGIVHERRNCHASRGDEMGHFELAGSTVIQLFTHTAKETINLLPKYQKVLQTGEEIRVKQGQVIGVIQP